MFNNTKFNRNSYSTVGEFVYSEIKKQIINWTLKPGQQISEAEMSLALNVSRTPVRESFIKLKNDGLVEIFSQRGTLISKIDIKVVEENVFVRINLEKAVIGLLTKSISKEYIDLCNEYLLKQYEAINEKNYYEFYKYDVLFHKVFFLACNKENTWNFIQASNSQYERVRMLTLLDIDNFETIYNSHIKLLKAIIDGNKQEAELIIDSHISELEREIEICKSEHPTYFLQD